MNAHRDKAKPDRPVMIQLTHITCTRGCGYYRPYNDCPDFLDRAIDHPLYGTISGRALVALEVSTHNCIEYLEARKRLAERMNDGNSAAQDDRQANVA